MKVAPMLPDASVDLSPTEAALSAATTGTEVSPTLVGEDITPTLVDTEEGEITPTLVGTDSEEGDITPTLVDTVNGEISPALVGPVKGTNSPTFVEPQSGIAASSSSAVNLHLYSSSSQLPTQCDVDTSHPVVESNVHDELYNLLMSTCDPNPRGRSRSPI